MGTLPRCSRGQEAKMTSPTLRTTPRLDVLILTWGRRCYRTNRVRKSPSRRLSSSTCTTTSFMPMTGLPIWPREHPEAQIDMAFLMRIIPCVCSSSRFPVRALGPAVGTSLSSGRFHRWSEPGGFVVSSSFATVPQPAEETDRVTQSIRGGSESGATLLGNGGLCRTFWGKAAGPPRGRGSIGRRCGPSQDSPT